MKCEIRSHKNSINWVRVCEAMEDKYFQDAVAYIKNLKQDLENEKQRADELSDKIDRLYEGSHESDIIISKDEYKDYKRMGDILNTLINLQDDIREDMIDKSNRGDVSEYTKNKIREFIDMELE